MGLDGISINQLRATPEMNSAELNSVVAFDSQNIKAIDGLAQGQRVDPDKESEHGSSDLEFFEGDKNHQDDDSSNEIVTKYDLSDSNKFLIKLDDISNQILIIEKSSGNVIQSVNADVLSHLVSFSSDSCGAIINKRF